MGCGAGNNLLFAANNGFDCYGIDASEKAIELAKSFFDENPEIIINKLKSNNLIQFANFVDIKLIKEKYLLYI